MLSGNEDLRYKRPGIKMINDQEPLVIKALEQDLIRSGYSYNKVRRHFAAFLLELFENGTLRKIFGERLPNLVPHLKEAVANEEMDRNNVLFEKLRGELWELDEQQCGPDADLSHLARCVLVCFGTEDRWLEGDSGDLTPLYLYYMYLRRVAPGLQPLLIRYFCRCLTQH
ncbi:hypothetical protein [Pseudomonas sp. AK106]